jgi:hypothetical protein
MNLTLRKGEKDWTESSQLEETSASHKRKCAKVCRQMTFFYLFYPSMLHSHTNLLLEDSKPYNVKTGILEEVFLVNKVAVYIAANVNTIRRGISFISQRFRVLMWERYRPKTDTRVH